MASAPLRRRIETRTSDRASNSIDPNEMVKLDALPEGCIAHILSLTTPRDAARSSAVSRTFRSAADSDVVWDKFLPPDLDLIVSTDLPQPPLGPSMTRKKDVFLRLSGTKSFALERGRKKFYRIGTQDLSIVSCDAPRYWRQRSPHVSRFPKVEQVLRVCWLEVHAKMAMRLLSANTYYAAYLIFKFVDGSYGFENRAMEVSIFSGSGGERRNICLDPGWNLRQLYQSAGEISLPNFQDASATREVQVGKAQIPRDRRDGWKEVHLGKFFVDDPPDGEVQIKLMELKGGYWKFGLVIHRIELRPAQKTSRERNRQRIGRQR